MSAFNPQYSFRLFLAAIFSLSLAVFFDIPNPYWAVMPVWILVQGSREEIFEKGLWRILGTMIGAILSIIIALYVPTLWLKVLLLSLILALTTSLNLSFKGLTGYGLQMIGITMGAIVLPAMNHPEEIMSFSLARTLCTLIGVIAVGVFTYKILPKNSGEALYQKLLVFHQELLSFDFTRAELLEKLAILEEQSQMSFSFFKNKDLRKKYDDYLLHALDYLMGRNAKFPAVFKNEEQTNLTFHFKTTFYSHLSLRVGLVVFVLSLIGASIGLYSGWTYGPLLGMGICVLSAVLGGMSIPRNIAPHMLLGVCLGALTAFTYRGFIQPYLTSPLLVVLGTAPIFLIGAILRTHKNVRLASVDFNMIFLLAGQVGMTPQNDLGAVFESTLPILIAGLVVTGIHIYFPRPYLDLAQKFHHKLTSSSPTKSILDYLILLRRGKADLEFYQRALDNFTKI